MTCMTFQYVTCLFTSSDSKNIHWSREQLADPNVARVKKLVESVFCTKYSDLRTESPVVLKYLRGRKKVFTC